MGDSNRRAVRFTAATLGVSWACVAVFVLLGGEWGTLWATAFAVGYMFVPLGVSVVLARLVDERSVFAALGVGFRPNRWWAVAVVVPLALSLAALAASLLVPGVAWDPEMSGMYARYASMLTPEQVAEMRAQVDTLPVHPFWLALGQAIIAGPTVNALAAFGEEAGWRGYLHDALRGHGFWRMSLTVGAIWGVWHAPIIALGHNYPDHPIAGIFAMTAFTMAYAPLHHWIRERSGSVVPAAFMHGTVNATAGLSMMTLTHGPELLVGILGVAGILTLVLANVVLAVVDRRFLSQVGSAETSSDA